MQASRRLAHRGLNAICAEQMAAAKEAGTFKVERVLATPQRVNLRVEGDTREVLNFCANNYLGLANHPLIETAAKKAIDDYGFGCASVRFICGTQKIHKDLERKLAKFHDMDDAILFPSCFDANAGLFEAILTDQDAIISDALNHASIIDGVRLCKAQRFRYQHLDMVDLEAKLVDATKQGKRLKLIATDGIFSMDGDLAPLKEIRRLADKYDAIIFVDDCHATGFLGPHGKGTPHLHDVKVDIVNTTLGKAMGGGTGGYTVANQDVITLLRNKARPYLFSNSVAPSVVGASIAAFDLIEKEGSVLQARLQDNTKYVRDMLGDAGFQISGHKHCPIVPVMLGDASLATEFAQKMLDRGIYVIGFSYPVVPMGTARVRTQLSAAHTKEQLQKLVASFVGVAKELGVLEQFKGEAYEQHYGKDI